MIRVPGPRQLLFAALLTATLAAVPARLAAADADETVHYWNGQQRVELALALDELEVESAAADAGRAVRAVRGLAASAPLAARALGEARAHLRFAAGGRAALAAQARALAGQPGVLAVDAVLYPLGGPRAAAQRETLGRRLALRLRPGQDVAALALRRGLRVVERVAYSPDTWILESADGAIDGALAAANALFEQDGAVFATPLLARKHAAYGTPTDPLFAQQWHLRNDGTAQVPGGAAGNDIDVVPIWDFAGGHHLGTGINIALVDDGTELTHEDLTANARADLGINFNGAPGGPTDPSPGITDFHGTWTAGVAAARDGDAKGGVGVAPRAGIVAVRLIAGATTDAEDAQAMGHQSQPANAADRVHISSNSWGPVENGHSLVAPGPLMLAAMQDATANGRGGKGIVYVFACGNGRDNGENVAYNGIASNRLAIAVAASDQTGSQTFYSESGCSLLVNAPGGLLEASPAASAGIVTTDRTGLTGTTDPDFTADDFPGNYTTIPEGLQGTSFACPIVAGVAALVLEANPALSWREVQHVLVRSAARNDPSHPGWQRVADNGYGVPGRWFNHAYGYGRVDAAAAVTLADPATWVAAPAEATPLTASEAVAVAIPDNATAGITRTLSIPAQPGFRIEHVELTVNITHTYRGDLHFRLTSPHGMVSDIPGRAGDSVHDFSNWTFTSAADWGEDPAGTWTLNVADEILNETGTLNSWSLKIHGYVAHPAPTLTGLSPTVASEGAPDTTLSLVGSGFIQGVTRVQWNGAALATTVVSATQLTALVPAVDLAVAGTATVRAVNPDFDGGAAQVSTGRTFTVTGPAVTGVGSPLADGTYATLGFAVPVTVTFTAPVVVTGIPTLALNVAPSGVAAYSGGSGSTVLTFTYLIGDGDLSAHLDCLAGGLALSGGTIKDLAGSDALVALPAPGASGSLGAARSIAIAGNLALVTAVTSSAANGVYGRGAVIPIQVVFSKPVTVSGAPRLGLATLQVPASAAYSSGSGSDTLTFSLVVGENQSTPDLEVAAAGALSLEGGAIVDAGGHPALLTLPAAGQPGSLGANKDLIIDSPPAEPARKKCGIGHLFSLILLLAIGAVRVRTRSGSPEVRRSGSP